MSAEPARAAVLAVVSGRPDREDLLVLRLFEAGATGIELTERSGRVRAGFADAATAAAALDAVPEEVTWTLLDVDDDQLWRASWEGVEVGRRLAVQPPWVAADAFAERLVVVIDPESAFGAGTHASTILALEALEGLVATDTRMLDVGTGTGVLGIAALRMGARHVTAVDTDRGALVTARRNAERNGVSERMATCVDGAQGHGPFDGIVANLLLSDQCEVGPSVVGQARGWIVLSGLLAGQVDTAVAAWPGLDVVEERHRREWACVVLGRRLD